MKAILHTTIYRQEGITDVTAEKPLCLDADRENELLNLHPEVKYQRFDGFGAALTDAAAYVYTQMETADRKKAVESYFGGKGIGYNRVRIPMDSCDFSLEQFQAVTEEEDEAFTSFSLEREKKYIYPLWQDLKKVCGGIEVMATPWSPPSFMKTNGERLHGGKLKADCRKAYASYLCLYIRELKKIGIPVSRISVQNEPKAVQSWDSCIFEAQEEKEFLRDFLYPALQENGLSDVGIYIWDHNKERVYERACAIIDETTAHMVKGIAFHWYSGDHFEELSMVREKFPELEMVLSEACIEYSKFAVDGELQNVKKYAHEIIGNLNAGMNAFYDWNMILDGTGGPNHADNLCDAPLMYHEDTKRLEERMTFSAIAHFSKYIEPGAVRIGCSRYSELLEAAAFENPDGSIVFVVFNRSMARQPVTVRIKDMCASFELEGFSITSGRIL